MRSSRLPPAADTGDTTSGTNFGREAVEQQAGAAHTSAMRVLEYLPSIHVESTDGLGLGVDPNPMRVRGQLGDTYARFANTVERVPLGISVARGTMGNMVDLENVGDLSFHRGAVPADRGFGCGTTAGALNSTLVRPATLPQLRIVMGGGGFDATRPTASLFARADSGAGFLGLRSFISGSYNHAHKWRGPGTTARFNGTIGLARAIGDHVEVELYGIVNHLRGNEYRPLTYAQAQDLSTYRSFDFTDDGTYLDYRNNRQDLTEMALITELHVRLGDRGSILIEPYATNVDGVRFFGTELNPRVNGVNRMALKQRQYGLIAEAQLRLVRDWQAVLGMWLASLDTVPPPKDQKFYTVSVTGELEFSRWNHLSQSDPRTMASPYVAVRGSAGRLSFDTGVRLVAAGMPSVVGYDPSGLPDVSADVALAGHPARKPGLYANGQTQYAILPHLGLRVALADALAIRAGYGRNYAYPFQGPLVSAYSSNAESFGNLGLTLNDLWNRLRLETSDNIDLGLHIRVGRIDLRPTIYYARFHDKQVLAYDPTVGASYYQNVGSAEGKGGELEVSGSPWAWLSVWLAGSYNRTAFKCDLSTKSSTPLATTGKQFADVPLWLGKLGVTTRWREWSLSPFLRVVGARYGDLMNRERVDGYGVLDLVLSYRIRPRGWLHHLDVSLRGQNVLDARYIGMISNQQDVSEALATSYHPGAPRFWMLSIDGTLAGSRP